MRFRAKGPVFSGFIALGLITFGYTTDITAHVWRSISRYRSSYFTDKAYVAWLNGSQREAELAFDSAISLDSENRRAQLLYARMLLQIGKKAAGKELFNRVLSAEKGSRWLETADLYADTLLGTAWFDELAKFTLTSRTRLNFEQRLLWGSYAIEAVRLARLKPNSDPTLGPPLKNPPDSFGALLESQLRLNAGQKDAARLWLAVARGPEIQGPLQATMLRITRDLEDRDRGRTLLNGSAEPLSPDTMAFNELRLQQAPSSISAKEFEALVFLAFPQKLDANKTLLRLTQVLVTNQPNILPALANRFDPNSSQNSAEVLSVLWLIWELDRANLTDNPWLTPLNRQIKSKIYPLGTGSFSAGKFIAVVNTLKLTRITIAHLLTRVTPPEPNPNSQ